MIDLTVKTLDSRNHAYSMPDDATVQQLKAKIEETMNIPANRQRLIFHGRVMQDDKKLSEYEVHGMVIHLVKSQPPQPGSRQSGSSGSSSSNSADNSGRFSQPRYFGRVDGSTMFGSVVIPVIGGETGARQGNRAWRLISTADRMLQRAVEVLDSYDNSPSRSGASRSASAAASVTTTPYNSSRDSSGSHSPTTEPSQPGRTSADSRTPTTATAQSSTPSGPTEMDTEMDTDGNTSTPHITVSNADQSAASTSSATSGAPNTAGNSQESSTQDSNQQRQQNRSPTTSNMATLLAKLRAVQNRFNPLLMRYHNLISEDPPTSNPTVLAERLLLTQTVPEVLHLLSHAYHAVSDLTIDWELAPPRQMRAVLAPAIQQLVQLTEGMNPWGLTIPSNFAQPAQTPAPGAGSTATPNAPASTVASTGSSAAAPSSASSTATSGVPEVTYMTTTFPAEGGEATTTFTTRPAADFETANGSTGSSGSATAPNRTPVVTASVDISATQNPGFTAALNTVYAIANRIAAFQSGQQSNQQQQQQQSQETQGQQQDQQQQQQQQPQQQQQQHQEQQQPPQTQSLPGQARGSSIVTLPVGMIDIPANVEFFMEVGPSTITIDSVEATMVTSGNFTPGTNGVATDGNPLNINFPWGSPPPQEFLTSVVQALNRIITSPGPNPNLRRRGSAPESSQNPNLQRRGSAPESENAETNATNGAAGSTAASGSTSETNSGNGHAAGSSPSGASPGQTSQARGYTATHPTTSTQTRSTARPHVHHISAAQLPGYAGYTDPFLPCHSQFFATWRRNRPSANTGAPMTANNSTQTSNPAQGTQPSTTAAAQATGSAASIPASVSTATHSASSSATAEPASSAHSSHQTNQGIIDSANAIGVAQTSLLNLAQSLAGSSSGNDALLTSVLGSLVAASNQGNQTEVPIINWIFPSGDVQEGESLLSDLRLAFVRSVTVSDLVALTGSNWDAVNHIRADLRNFVIQRLCEGSPSEEHLEQGANLLMNELRPHFDIILEGTLKDDVDAVASLNRFHESIVPEFLKLILDDEHAAHFGQNLHDVVHKYLGHLWAIVKHCCANNEAIDALLQSCMSRVPQDVPFATWTARAYHNQLRLYTDSLSVPLQDIERFIVYRTPSSGTQEPLESIQPITASVASNCSSSPNNTNVQPRLHETSMQVAASADSVEPMDTDPLPAPQATTSAGASSLNVSSQSLSSEEAVTAKSDETPVLPMDTEVPPVPTPEAWHRILPPEWVPIIARDTTRQRRPNSQTPLSDAYLAGMPPKRRKVVTANKPQGSLSEVISANMETAIQSSGVSTAGISLVQEEAGSDPRLREAYREQLRATVRSSLANNPDFSAERFPNAAQYFGKS